MAIVIYGQPGCQQCKMTIRRLDGDRIPYKYKDISVDNDAHDQVTRVYGLSSLPVVSVDTDEVDLSDFTGGENPVVWIIDGKYVFTEFRVKILSTIAKQLKR